MTLCDILYRFQSRSRGYIDSTLIQYPSSHKLYLYKFNKTATQLEIPANLVRPLGSSLRTPIDKYALVRIENTVPYTLHKTGAAMLKDLFEPSRPNSFFLEQSTNTSYSRIFSTIFDSSNKVLIHFTKIVDINTFDVKRYVLRLNKSFIASDTVLGKYLKSTCFKYLLNTSIFDAPLDIVLQDSIESPLVKKVTRSPQLISNIASATLKSNIENILIEVFDA